MPWGAIFLHQEHKRFGVPFVMPASIHGMVLQPQAKSALILVGGFGTRLRPLTFTKPKPLVPFINIPTVVHQLFALKEVGVEKVVLAIGFDAKTLEAELTQWVKKLGLGIEVVYSLEETPLGT
eukprot:gene7180-6786_t